MLNKNNGQLPEPTVTQLATISLKKLHQHGFHEVTEMREDEDFMEADEAILEGQWELATQICLFLLTEVENQSKLAQHLLHIYSQLVALGEDPRCINRMFEVLQAIQIDEQEIDNAYEIGYTSRTTRHHKRNLIN